MSNSIKKINFKNMPFSRRIYLSVVFINQFMAAVIFITSNYITGNNNMDVMGFLGIYIFLSAFVNLFLGSITNKILCRKITNELNFMKASEINKTERTEILQKLCKFPAIKTIEVYAFFIICSIMLTYMVSVKSSLTTSDTIIFLISSFLLSYTSGVFTHYIVEKICSEIAIEISTKKIDDAIVKEKKYFGTPLSVLFVLYIIIPLITCSIYMILVFIKNYNGINTDYGRLIFCSLFNISIISLFTILYFRRINKYTKQMEVALSKINKNEIQKVTDLFPTDFSTNIAYSFYLINTTIRLFQNLISNYTMINGIIQQICQDLTSVSNQTQATLIQQTSSVEEISATIKNTNQLSDIIEKKVDEVINIASKTLDAANENNDDLIKNIEKIHEITYENKKTISSIQGLYNKINSVWDIVNIIDSVADQTKIIAFNAELEASLLYTKNNRLNSVSKEIRNLAEQTSVLTKEVRQQINEIQQSSDNLISLGRSCMEKIDDANNYSDLLIKKFNDICLSATSTSEDSELIKKSIYIQSSSMKQIENTLDEINAGVKDFTEMTNSITRIITILQQNTTYIGKISESYEAQETV